MTITEIEFCSYYDDIQAQLWRGSTENMMYSLAKISMSWLFNNMKRKVEDGHCNNTKHDHGDRTPRLCIKGNGLHKKLYDGSLKSFEGVLELAREHATKRSYSSCGLILEHK